MTKSNTKHQIMSNTRHQNGTKNDNTSSQILLDHWSLLYIRFVAVAFQLWRRCPLEKGPSLAYYGPAFYTPLGGFCQKINTNVRGHEYFISTKFGEYPSSTSDNVVKADYVFPYICMH